MITTWKTFKSCVRTVTQFKNLTKIQDKFTIEMRVWRNRQTRTFEGGVLYKRMGSSPITRTIDTTHRRVRASRVPWNS